jgi:hypothetical protein
MGYSKKQILLYFISLLLIASLTTLLTGCGAGLPKEIKSRAKNIPDTIKTAQSQVNKQKDKYKSLVNSVQFKKVNKFATKENWAGKFNLANDELNMAKTIYDKDLLPIIKKNKPELISAARLQIARINKSILNAKKLSKFAFLRFSSITDTIENAESLHSQAQKDSTQIFSIANKMKTGSFAKANKDFPDLKDKINTRFAPASNITRQSKVDLDVVAAAYKAHTAGSDADYAAFTDSVRAISSHLENIKTFETKFTKETGQLYLSYTKILKDMKEAYFVTIKRESWNENSDYYNPGFVTFQSQVSLEDYETLTAENLDTIATITPGFSGSKFKSNIGSLWQKLAIKPGERWPRRDHNAASFYIENSKEHYFHKYILEENGETKTTGWQKVEASFYEGNLAFLGMAILAKPYGVFEDERLTQAAPPGMAYVGNSKYGEWKKDNSGNSFWSWYGKYALFSTLFFPRPYYYPYSSWNSWNSGYRNNRPYFGKTQKGFQKFGTQGSFIKKSSKFQSTNFAKSGGLKRQSASVRGAGANLRGGGPKSKGK